MEFLGASQAPATKGRHGSLKGKVIEFNEQVMIWPLELAVPQTLAMVLQHLPECDYALAHTNMPYCIMIKMRKSQM